MILIGVYFITCGKSCGDGDTGSASDSARKAEMSRDSLGRAFGSGTLDESSLRAFEAGSIIKLRDLGDYLSILADSGSAREFRDKAKEMAAALFDQGLSLPEKYSGMSFDSAKVINPMQSRGDSMYTGSLGFVAQRSSNVKGRPLAVRGTAEIRLRKKEKIFGKDTLEVWQVLFGEFR